jgi:uncharacterized protein YkwD/uncharacterized membrane protein required for colicin V production
MSWPDLLVIALVATFAGLAVRRGFVAVLLSLGGFVLAFVLSLLLYPLVAAWLAGQLGWSPIWSKPAAFVALWIVTEMLVSFVGRHLISRQSYDARSSNANRVLAVIPGALQGLLFAAIILTMLALVPMQGEARRDILASRSGGALVQATLALERPLEGVFGPAARETLGFITVRPPQSGVSEGEGIELNFTVDDPTPDPEAEQGMLDLVNRERTQRGLPALEMDAELRLVARAHAADMFARGYFAHDTPDGTDPFERMRAANIIFGLAGENLALAPSLLIAHEGLMNSPGHRANILNGGFRKVGIGVLDGGIYGKMFVQEFTD